MSIINVSTSFVNTASLIFEVTIGGLKPRFVAARYVLHTANREVFLTIGLLLLGLRGSKVEFHRHGAEGIYYKIFRSDGSSRWIKTFSEMVTRFDRLDLMELYNLVMQRFETITPKGVDLVLWGDLRIMFDANAEDELWQNQERWNLKS
ncbi:hypothetical protein Tco_0661122 [Tanacetum coccineum]